MSLEQLPVELIAGICGFLPERDFLAFRETSLQLELASRDVFVKRHVEHLTAPVENLQRLYFVSESERLRHKVRALHLVTASVRDSQPLPAGQMQTTLTKVLSRFPNLSSVCLQPRRSSVRSFRGGLDAAYILCALIAPYASSSGRLQQLTTCAGSYHAGVSESLEVEMLDPDQLSTALSDLQSLHICSGHSAIWRDNSREPHEMLEKLVVAAAPSVKSLSFDMSMEFDAIQAALAFDRMIARAQFRNLAELKMASIRVSDASLRKLLEGLKETLRSLSLFYVQMQKTRSAIESCVRWRRFFEFLKDNFKLTSAAFSCLGHAGIYWMLVDPSKGQNTAEIDAKGNTHIPWKEDEGVCYEDWIGQVRFQVNPGDAYSTTMSGSHRFGSDVDLDGWLLRCGLGPQAS